MGGGCKVPGSKSRKFGRMTHRAVGGHFDSGWNDYGNSLVICFKICLVIELSIKQMTSGRP